MLANGHLTPLRHSHSINRYVLPIKLSMLGCKKDYVLPNHLWKRLEYLVYPVNSSSIHLNCMKQYPINYPPLLPPGQLRSPLVNPPVFPPNLMKRYTVNPTPFTLACIKSQSILLGVIPQPHHLSNPLGHNLTGCLQGIKTFCLNPLLCQTFQQPQPLQSSGSCWLYTTLFTCNSIGLA